MERKWVAYVLGVLLAASFHRVGYAWLVLVVAYYLPLKGMAGLTGLSVIGGLTLQIGAAAGTNPAGVSSKTVFVKGRDKCAGNRGAAGELWHGDTVVLVDKKGRKRGREKDRTSFKGVYV